MRYVLFIVLIGFISALLVVSITSFKPNSACYNPPDKSITKFYEK